MKNQTKIIDLTTTTLLGPSCKFFELLQDFQDNNHNVILKAKNWQYEAKGSNNLLWDPNKHPEDLYKNLILSTFPKIQYIEPFKYSFLDKLKVIFPPFFNKNRIVHYDFTCFNMELEELERYKKQQKNHFLSQRNFIGFVMYSLFVIYINFFFPKKIKPISKGFNYKLSNEKNTKNVHDFIKSNREDGVKNILISVLWDESMKFEVNDDRLKGGPVFKGSHEKDFDDLKAYVRELDDYAKKTGKIKFILASKKAVDWENFLDTEFIDLRNFEDLGFNMSQSIYIAQELSDVTINWPSTYSIWITNCLNKIHLTWHDNKDTAQWTRNNLNKMPIENLLGKLNINE
tara:strand:+ start:604 stop:1635 length:1032 start_codon:yes stop_codon:yes gene_type:complete